MINCRTATQERPPHPVRGPMLTALGLVLGLTLLVSEARAATYRVYTNTAASSMTVNPNDGQCSLAEAVLHVNGQNENTTYCTNAAPGTLEHRIELLQSPNRPYATNHFQITSLTITTTTRVSISGFGAFIDSSRIAPAFVYSAFVIGARGAPPSQWPTVFFERVTLTNTSGSDGGRLVENFGTLQLYGVTITKGDVTGSHHTTGRGGGIFNAGTISVAQNSLITGNKARKGGGIFNDAGIINDLAVTISNNTATLAGGGIYNTSTTPLNEDWTNGRIEAFGATIDGNSARAGGGVFNRGLFVLYQQFDNEKLHFGGGKQRGGVYREHFVQRLGWRGLECAPPVWLPPRDSTCTDQQSRTTSRPRAAVLSTASVTWRWEATP